jgi:hypothetical protein
MAQCVRKIPPFPDGMDFKGWEVSGPREALQGREEPLSPALSLALQGPSFVGAATGKQGFWVAAEIRVSPKKHGLFRDDLAKCEAFVGALKASHTAIRSGPIHLCDSLSAWCVFSDCAVERRGGHVALNVSSLLTCGVPVGIHGWSMTTPAGMAAQGYAVELVPLGVGWPPVAMCRTPGTQVVRVHVYDAFHPSDGALLLDLALNVSAGLWVQLPPGCPVPKSACLIITTSPGSEVRIRAPPSALVKPRGRQGFVLDFGAVVQGHGDEFVFQSSAHLDKVAFNGRRALKCQLLLDSDPGQSIHPAWVTVFSVQPNIMVAKGDDVGWAYS